MISRFIACLINISVAKMALEFVHFCESLLKINRPISLKQKICLLRPSLGNVHERTLYTKQCTIHQSYRQSEDIVDGTTVLEKD